MKAVGHALIGAALPALLLAAALPAAAEVRSTPGAAPERISTLVVYGNDPCPRSSDDEIVVCARQPESDRYRIPKKLRPQPYNAARDGSWAGTARVLESVSRQGLPNSCSPQGTNGQSGCFAKFLADARAQRDAEAAARANIP